MKKINFILYCLIIGFLITSCKKDDNDVEKKDSASDAVKTYFGYLKATNGLSSESNGKVKSLKIALEEPFDKMPDFFLSPYKIIEPDSSGSLETSQYMENGDYKGTIDYGDKYGLCKFVKWTSKDEDRQPIYYYYYLKGKIEYAGNYNEDKDLKTLNIQAYYPNTNKYYTIEGEINTIEKYGVEDGGYDHSYIIIYAKIKIGEIGKEFEFTLNQKSKWIDLNGKAHSIDEGTSQHARGATVYNTLINTPLIKKDNIISGRVKVTYSKDGKTGEFYVDYGDGTDDTKATITENGNVYEIDYVALQDEMYKSLTE